MDKKRVVLIGSGNVATSLAHALAARCEVAQIFSLTLSHATRLAEAVGCKSVTDDLNALVHDADAYIIAVLDDAIADVIAAVPDNGALWLHTSGSKPMDLFKGHRARYGVLYPMQSFSRQVVTPLDDVHIFVEACNEASLDDVKSLACLLSSNVIPADSGQRHLLHVAAVFACNFANHMWALSDDILTRAGLPFDAMKALISTTVDKLDRLTPAQSQTGPAMRNDKQVIADHLAMLDGDERDIYELITRSIIDRHNQDKDIHA